MLGPDRRTCELTIVPQRVTLTGFRDVGAMRDDPGVTQPLFNTQKLTTSTSLQVNGPHYLGSFTPPAERGIGDGAPNAKVWLAFVRMNLFAPTAAELKPPAKPARWWAIDLEYSFYSLDRTDARDLLIAPPALTAPWERLQTLLGEKKARFEHIISVMAKSGQKSTTEELHEVRYPTEFLPPGVTRSTDTTTTDIGKVGNNTTITTLQRETPNTDGAPGMPKAFDTRNAGMSVEVEPVVGPDSMTIELSHVVQSAGYLGELKITGVGAQYPSQPLFETRRSAGSTHSPVPSIHPEPMG